MTKIITKLPVSAEDFKNFRENALKKMIANATAKLEGNFSVLCFEFTNRFNANEWIFMSNKDLCYINDIFGIMPNLSHFDSMGYGESVSYNRDDSRLKFQGFQGDLMTESEAEKCFNNRITYFRNSSGGIAHSGDSHYAGLTYKKNGTYWWMYTNNSTRACW